MASDTLDERIQQHYAAEIAEVEREASDAAHAIIHQLTIALMSSADLIITLESAFLIDNPRTRSFN